MMVQNTGIITMANSLYCCLLKVLSHSMPQPLADTGLFISHIVFCRYTWNYTVVRLLGLASLT